MDFEAETTPDLKVMWNKNGKALPEKLAVTRRGRSTVAWDKLKESDQGVYEVVLKNGAGAVSSSATLIQKGKTQSILITNRLNFKQNVLCFYNTFLVPDSDDTVPRILSFNLPEKVEVGEDVLAEAKFTGSPTPTVIWRKDGDVLEVQCRIYS